MFCYIPFLSLKYERILPMKKRLITAAVTALLGLYLALIGAYNMHLALSRMDGFTFNPFTAMTVFLWTLLK